MRREPTFIVIEPTEDSLKPGAQGWNIDLYERGQVQQNDCGWFEKTLTEAIATAKDMAMDNDATFIVVISKSGRTRTIDIPQSGAQAA